MRKIWLTMISIIFISNLLVGQSLQHPHIWATANEKQEILSNIDKYEWAESMFNQLKQRNDTKKLAHLADPSVFLSNLTTIPGDRTKHREDLNTAAECAILYYLTDDEGYAQLSSDIIYHYMKIVSVKNPLTIYFFGAEGDPDNHHIMCREVFPRIAISYDFIYPFIAKTGTTVYDLASQSHVPFNFTTAQKSLEVMAENVLRVGGMNNNHPLLELAGGLYSALCMDDDSTRTSYYNRFWIGERGQNGISWMIDHFAKDGDIWPEAMGYSKGVHGIMMRIMNVIDRYIPDENYINNNLRLLNGAFVFENFKYPNNAIMAYGDSHRTESETDEIIRYVHAIAKRKGLTDYDKKAASVLKAQYELKGGYKPELTTERLNWGTPLELLWGVNIEDSISSNSMPLYTTVQAKFARVVMQRNYVSANNEDYGLMYYTGGATYVHAHATGIDMEIYGAGYVIGPDYGRNVYGSAIHEEYVVSYAAHNTIIVNGKSARGPKTNGNGTWQNIVDDIVLEACEPSVREEPLSNSFCFSTQYLDDSFNKCKQKRTNSIVRTSPTSGYYIDIFRSKSNATNNFHDYLFHGLGDVMNINNKNGELALANTPDRYQNDIGDYRKQPGWRWFSSAKTSAKTKDAIRARFDLNATKKYLHLNVPGGIEREYTSALAPATKDVKNGYSSKSTQVFAMRKYGEAWDKPFIAVYEPSGNSSGTVQSVENIEQDGKIVGAIVTSLVDGKEIKDYIISLDKEGTIIIPEHFISFKGRFGIIRKEPQSETTETITLYIGSGERLSYADLELLGDAENKNVNTFYGVQKMTPDTRFTISTQVFGGGGTITKQPDQADYAPGTQVVVVANPNLGNVVDTWLGNAEGSASTDTLTLFSDKNVFLRFREGEYFSLNISSEHGTVTKSEQGTEFIEGTCIDLTAVPAEGYAFDGWSGDVTSSYNPLSACLNSNLNITANFKLGTALSEVLSNSIVVSPNPSTGVFNVNVQQASNWFVYDVTGKLLESGSADGSFELDLTAFKKSIYLLSIRTNNGIDVKHIIVR